jgi:hypothetical protein
MGLILVRFVSEQHGWREASTNTLEEKSVGAA